MKSNQCCKHQNVPNCTRWRRSNSEFFSLFNSLHRWLECTSAKTQSTQSSSNRTTKVCFFLFPSKINGQVYFQQISAFSNDCSGCHAVWLCVRVMDRPGRGTNVLLEPFQGMRGAVLLSNLLGCSSELDMKLSCYTALQKPKTL